MGTRCKERPRLRPGSSERAASAKGSFCTVAKRRNSAASMLALKLCWQIQRQVVSLSAVPSLSSKVVRLAAAGAPIPRP